MNTYDNIRLTQEIPFTSKGKVDYARLNKWFTPNVIVHEDEAIIVRHFTYNCFNRDTSEPVLLLPPQTAHTGTIIDYDRNQSLVECAMNNTNKHVYCIEWKPCTKNRCEEDYYSLIEQTDKAINVVGGKVNLYGMCQAGVVSLVYTSLFQSKVESVTIAGAPVEITKEGILQPAISKPMSLYEATVAMCGGVMSGVLMLECFKSGNLTRHYVDRFFEKLTYKKARFDAWYYEHVQDIAGGWYLEIVEKLFKNNQLTKGNMQIRGKEVLLSNITCPVNIIVGKKDDISPKAHSWNIDRFLGTPAGNINKFECEGGHIGIYCGNRSVNTVWVEIFNQLKTNKLVKPKCTVENTSIIYTEGLNRGEDVTIHKSCYIYPNVTLGDNCTIKNGCIIEEGAVILPNITVPSGTHIKPEEVYG